MTLVPQHIILKSRATWNPTFISTALWLDAADAGTITESGGAVSQWDDKSGNNHHVIQATAAARPTYSATAFNGQPTIFFDATDDLLACATTTVSSQGDLFYAAVFEMLSDNKQWRPIVGTNTSENSSNAGTLILQRMSTRSQIGVHNAGRVDTGSTYAVEVTNLFIPRIATVGRSGGTQGDGGTITVTATGPSQPSYLTQAVQTWNTNELTSRIQVGGRQQNGTGYSNSRISEVVAMNRNATTTERQKFEGYLAHKWGLTGDLPSNHPYKTVEPTI